MFQEFMKTKFRSVTIVVEKNDAKVLVSMQTQEKGLVCSLTEEELERLIYLLQQAQKAKKCCGPEDPPHTSVL